MITHPTQSMFIGTLPMGFATIVNMLCFVCVPAWGDWARDFAWAMWIIDAAIAVVTALSLPFMLYVKMDAKKGASADTFLECLEGTRPSSRQ
jgi:hypothetical protein